MRIWLNNQMTERKPCNVALYSGVMSELYDTSWNAKLDFDEVRFFKSLIGKGKALEIATGTGRLTLPLLQEGVDLYGIEGASSSMLEKLFEKLEQEQQSRFILWNALQYPFPAAPETFSAIIVPYCTFGLLHNGVENHGDNSLIKEFFRLLKPKGQVVINDFRTEPLDKESIETLNDH
uniref:Methyltransferase domain-containing protein n=1 Tax=Candidatus Kentrum sp. LPFa TaxID=2126335 RepID=A0A450W7R9_9GAMM|nr:MAG: Methyltransferase domain-containing protein [Candidatus Kentron sp. LPFa]